VDALVQAGAMREGGDSVVIGSRLTAVILIGAQAAGKSTFYHRYFVNTHLRINLDMLRTRTREAELVALCCRLKQPFAVDNTNPTAADRTRYLRPAAAAGFSIIGYYFSSRVRELLAHNRRRPQAERVPDKAIFGTVARLELPAFNEGFKQLFYVGLDAETGFKIKPWQDEV
jgi:predicted kinase